MTEKEILEKISESADQVETPESLSPKAVQEQLERQGARKKPFGRRTGAMAAGIAIMLCATSLFAASRLWGGTGNQSGDAKNSVEQVAEDAPAKQSQEAAGGSRESGAEKRSAGELYKVAGNYEEVYKVLQNSQRKYARNGIDIMEDAMTAGDSTAYSFNEKAMDPAEAPGAAADMGAEKQEEISYSTTNLQTEGVDESDLIKTDGSYIYSVGRDTVRIVDIREGKLELAGTIPLAFGSGGDQALEMYVDKDRLILAVQQQKASLARQEGAQEAVPESQDSAKPLDNTTTPIYVMDTAYETKLMTFDISDRANPKLLGEVSQEGFYHTSRKIGDIVYLFTDRGLAGEPVPLGAARVAEGDFVPYVNGEKIAADSIFIPSEGEEGLIISSMNVKSPDQTVDEAMIVNNAVEIYVSTQSLYLYNSNYQSGGSVTEIAKFSLKDGFIQGVGATTAAGTVTDTFAINEREGKLRLLTTDTMGGQDGSSLYLFDGNLALTGKLEGIAKGEQIYAARYMGNMAYFVTYRNTDPLFAVDLSDDTKPVILGELKITGFSEYLHFWGEDRILGIGYETDPETGSRKGLKMTMFDRSDPANLKAVESLVIDNLDYSPALDLYKCVLADDRENLIGFAVTSYSKGKVENSYLLFRFAEGKFEALLTTALGENAALEEYRGLYAGDTFYLAGRNEILSYGRKEGYQQQKVLEY